MMKTIGRVRRAGKEEGRKEEEWYGK